jgi:hypothetical protein
MIELLNTPMSELSSNQAVVVGALTAIIIFSGLAVFAGLELLFKIVRRAK